MRLRGTRGPIIRRHPLTGEPIEPVGVVNNKIVWPIMGGAPDEDEDEDEDDDDSDSGADDDKQDDDDTDDDTDKGDKGDTVSREEFESAIKRMKAADKRAAEAEKKIKEQEDAKKDDLTKSQDRVTELESQVETLTETVSSLRLQNAFLVSNSHQWHNADAALKLARSEGYLDDLVDEDGDVDKAALKKALDKLAKDHKYLVAKKKSKSDDDSDDDGPSGESASGRKDKNGKDKKARQKQLQGRFPALNR